MTWLFRPDAILDKASRTEDVQPSERQTPWSGRSSLNMEIVCSRSTTVWTLGQHHPDATLFRKDFQANSESRLHSCPFEHPQLLSRCRLGKSYQTRFRFSVAYKWTPPRHVICKNSVLNSVELREFILGVVVLIRSLSSHCRCVLLLCWNWSLS
jgi:hypothetical protein